MSYEKARKALLAAGIEQDRIAPTGAPQWDAMVWDQDAGYVFLSLLPDGSWLAVNPRGASWSDISASTPQRLIAEHRQYWGGTE